MSRTEAKRRFSIKDHERMTACIECRKDADVIDETPAAYKSIEDVMAAQADLVEIVHTPHQAVSVKGWTNLTANKFSNVQAGVCLSVQGLTVRDATGASQSRGRGPASARRSRRKKCERNAVPGRCADTFVHPATAAAHKARLSVLEGSGRRIANDHAETDGDARRRAEVAVRCVRVLARRARLREARRADPLRLRIPSARDPLSCAGMHRLPGRA